MRPIGTFSGHKNLALTLHSISWNSRDLHFTDEPRVTKGPNVGHVVREYYGVGEGRGGAMMISFKSADNDAIITCVCLTQLSSFTVLVQSWSAELNSADGRQCCILRDCFRVCHPLHCDGVYTERVLCVAYCADPRVREHDHVELPGCVGKYHSSCPVNQWPREAGQWWSDDTTMTVWCDGIILRGSNLFWRADPCDTLWAKLLELVRAIVNFGVSFWFSVYFPCCFFFFPKSRN